MEREMQYENIINIGLYHLCGELMEKFGPLYSYYLNKYEDDGEVCEMIGNLFEDINIAINEFFANTSFKDKIRNAISQVYFDGKTDGVKNYAKKEGE